MCTSPNYTKRITINSDEDQDDITASWNLVINKFRETLSEFDFAELQRFPTPDKLLEDLKKKEPSKPHFQWVRRPIRTLRSFLKFFVVTMSPRNLESSIFWGLFYLLIEVLRSVCNITEAG
jgi:hypothetical protein